MTTSRPFSADTNKLAYAQAFSRSSSRHVERAPRTLSRRSLFPRRGRKSA